MAYGRNVQARCSGAEVVLRDKMPVLNKVLKSITQDPLFLLN